MAPQESKESKLLASKTKEEGKIIQKVISIIIDYAYSPRFTSARHLPNQSICLHKEFVSAFYVSPRSINERSAHRASAWRKWKNEFRESVRPVVFNPTCVSIHNLSMVSLITHIEHKST